MRKILIIRFRRVGDAVLTSVLCSTLKKSIPGAEIHYVLNENIAPLFEHHPDIDKLILFNSGETHSFFRYIRKIWKLMRKERYDIIIDTRSTFNTLYFSLFSINTKYRIGVKKKYTTPFFTHPVRQDTKDYIQRQLILAAPLEKEFNILPETAFKVYPTKEEIDSFRNYMNDSGVDPEKPVIICTVSTRIPHKHWPLKPMKELLSKLLDTYDIQLIFNYGGKEEMAFAQELYEKPERHPRVFFHIQANNLRELSAMLANADFLFGNEGGPRHIAQALQVPSFAIFPPGVDMETWLPDRGERYNGIQASEIDADSASDPSLSYEQKFKLISVEAVWKGLEASLRANLKDRLK